MQVSVASQTRPELAAPHVASTTHSAQTYGCTVVTQIGRAAGHGVATSHSSIGVVVGLPGVAPLPDGYVVVGFPLRPSAVMIAWFDSVPVALLSICTRKLTVADSPMPTDPPSVELAPVPMRTTTRRFPASYSA